MPAISIHAPREGGDVYLAPFTLRLCGFQSTPPARGATVVLLHKGVRLLISIHAPREGGDNVISTLAPAVGISIHAPREGGDYNTPDG